MLQFTKPIPLSLYIHIPWCIQKCPYCDFNSHTFKGELPEQNYLKRLIHDLEQDLSLIDSRAIHSIFIGGGTPSLITPEGYQFLFRELHQRLNISSNVEITLEANPGTVEQSYFKGYVELGINRVSLGIQSLQNDKLKALGRIHDTEQAITAVETARLAGFKNINLDLMYGLPQQGLLDALSDLKQAIELKPDHLSWYHLTLEPNTLFHKYPPPLPKDELIWDMQEQGQALLAANGFEHYEISAYAKTGHHSKHNLNYWQFGDYLGIGAGAHGKLTDIKSGKILRSLKLKSPKDYLDPNKNCRAKLEAINPDDLPLEFMMNSLRLYSPIALDLFSERCGLSTEHLSTALNKASSLGLLSVDNQHLQLSKKGHLFLNDVLEIFMRE